MVATIMSLKLQLFLEIDKEDGSNGEQTYDTSRDMAQGTGGAYLNAS